MIINADDFGYDERITEAIIESFQRGYVNQTTLMVNMPDADRAVARAKELGIADKIGLHFNIAKGRPLTEAMSKSKFCVNGKFDGLKQIGYRFFINYDRESTAALAEEARAQVKKYVEYGLSLMHCDSHCHMHTRLPIARVLFQILKEYGFKSVRRPYNLGFGWNLRDVMRRFRNGLFALERIKAGLKTTTGFGDVGKWGMDDVEIMVHPRYNSKGILVNCTDYQNNDGQLMENLAI